MKDVTVAERHFEKQSHNELRYRPNKTRHFDGSGPNVRSVISIPARCNTIRDIRSLGNKYFTVIVIVDAVHLYFKFTLLRMYTKIVKIDSLKESR